MPSNFPAPQLPDPSFPSVEQLTRIANTMFTALHGTSQSVPQPNLGGAPTPGIPLLVDALPLATPAPLPGIGSTASLTPVAPLPATSITTPASPFGAIGPAPAFYFLEEIAQHSAAINSPPGLRTMEPEIPGLSLSSQSFDVDAIRRDFPILREQVNGKQLIWLDNAATTQKPQPVIDRVSHFYRHENSNIHRAAHELAARATDAYEEAREQTARFLNAPSSKEIVFTRGATEAINLVAQTWGRQNVGEGDEILITHLEHHANIVPWQQLCAEKKARLNVAPVDESGQVLLDQYQRLLSPRTKIVAFPHVSNALGTVTPAKEMVEMAHRYGALVLVDGAQAVSHMRTDVQHLDCDWYVLSGHKVFAPTGIGVLYGKADVLDSMPPWQGGGNMIQDVTFEKTTYHKPPGRFEAGTGSIADAVGLGAALAYVERIGIENISRYEHELLVYASDRMQSVPGLKMIGTSPEKAGVLSFILAGYKPEEVGSALSHEGIAVRAGHHCAQPILRRFGLESTVRPSLAFYNTCAEIDAMIDVLRQLARQR